MKYVVLLLLFLNIIYASSKLSCVGSTTMQPVIEQVSNAYKEKTDVTLSIRGGGSLFGVNSVLSDKADIGMVSRDLSDNEKKRLSYVTIGYDSLAFIVNSSNPLENISTKNLIKLYLGEIDNWQTLDGKNENVKLISKLIDRGTLAVFEKYSGIYHPKNPKNSDKNKMISKDAWEAGANNDMIVWVGGLPNSIGFISYGSASKILKYNMPIKILSLDNVKPSKKNIQNKTYPISRPLTVVFKPNNQKAKEFAFWMLENFPQNIIEKNFFIRTR